MNSVRSLEILPLDFEIEHTLRSIRKEKAVNLQVVIMADNHQDKGIERFCNPNTE